MGEASATLAAGERLLSAVSEPVGSQHALQTEAQLTLGALEGLLVGVQALVPQQLSPLAEVPATLSTPERLLPAVHSAVLGEFALFREALAALPAGEGSLSTVHMLVECQQAAQLEALVTLQAPEGLFSHVHPGVAGELGPGREGHVAFGAREQPLPGGAALGGRRAPLQVAMLLTHWTWAWLLSPVHTAELGLLTEGPVAFPMGQWPLLARLALVSLHAVLQEKALVT